MWSITNFYCIPIASLIQCANPLGWRLPLNKMKKPALKAGTRQAAGKNGKSRGSGADKPPATAAPPQPTEAKTQYEAFERGIQLLHQRNFRQAKEMFERARQGPSRRIAANATLHAGMCERRLAAPAPEPKSVEEHYNYAVALINLRNLSQASAIWRSRSGWSRAPTTCITRWESAWD